MLLRVDVTYSLPNSRRSARGPTLLAAPPSLTGRQVVFVLDPEVVDGVGEVVGLLQ